MIDFKFNTYITVIYSMTKYLRLTSVISIRTVPTTYYFF